MSVLSTERTITPKELIQFIPIDEESTQLATISHSGDNHSFESEREILYKILFELRGNVSDLRRDLNSLRKQLDDRQTITDSMAPALAGRAVPQHTGTPLAEDAIAEEISEPESLNLSDLGKQMVERALERNGGNRKKAAQELGISDRTLYRKLKQYGL